MTRRLLVALSLVGLILAWVTPAAAVTGAGTADDVGAADGPTARAGEIQVLRVDEGDRQVTIEIAIPASIGQLAPVAGNFAVTVDGRVQDFGVSPLTTVVDVILVLDTSGSMRGEALDAAKSAATRFIERLPEEARIGVVSFGETVTVHRPPDQDRAAALAAVSGLTSAGETALWDGLVAAADLAAQPGTNGQPYVVVLSDGDDTVSRATQDDAVAALVDGEIGLYAIAIESPDADGATLEQTVGTVGGDFAATTGLDRLDALYLEVADRLASRYELTFEPPTERASAEGVDVVVSVAAGTAVATAQTTLQAAGATIVTAERDSTTTIDPVDDGSGLGLVPAPDPGLLGSANMLMVGGGLLFLALLLIATMLLGPTIRVRLDTAANADQVAGLHGRMTKAADSVIAKRDEEGELDKALDAAGLNLRPGEFVLLAMVFVVGSSMAVSLVAGFLGGLAAAVAACVAVFAYLSVRADRRRAKFADQLTDTIGIMTGSLRAGRGLPQAIELVASEAPTPTADQFRRIVFETRVGRDMTTSMLGVADRMRSQDLEWLTRAVDINREMGGDLTEVFDNVADTIRDRRRVARMVRALSAEGRASGWVLLALPVVMFLFMWWRTPENIALLVNEPLGRGLLAIGLLGMTVGFFWIRKLVDLKY